MMAPGCAKVMIHSVAAVSASAGEDHNPVLRFQL